MEKFIKTDKTAASDKKFPKYLSKINLGKDPLIIV